MTFALWVIVTGVLGYLIGRSDGTIAERDRQNDRQNKWPEGDDL